VIGTRPEIKTTSQLIEALRSTKIDRLKVIENATPRDVESYMRRVGSDRR
jgi:UDP-N-acetylglucosamine 2-epimerase